MSASLYWEEHAGRGPHLLLVHGVLSSRAQWLDNLAVLGEFCRPVVVELFGHGRSPSPQSPRPYSPVGYAEEFQEAGGEQLDWVESLNSRDIWIKGVQDILLESLNLASVSQPAEA